MPSGSSWARAAPGGRVKLRAAGLAVLAGVGLRCWASRAGCPARSRPRRPRPPRLPSAAPARAPASGALARTLEGFVEAGRRVATTHIATSGASAVRLVLLGRLLGPSAGSGSSARVNRLLAGLDGLESAEPATALEALAAEAARRPDWEAWLSEAPRPGGGGASPWRGPGRSGRNGSGISWSGSAIARCRKASCERRRGRTIRRRCCGRCRECWSTAGSAGFGRRAGRRTRRIEEEALMGQTRLGPPRTGPVRTRGCAAGRSHPRADQVDGHRPRAPRPPAGARRRRGPGRGAGASAAPTTSTSSRLAELVTALDGGPVPARGRWSGAGASSSASAAGPSPATWTWTRPGGGGGRCRDRGPPRAS